jgi:multicomponent Na+:H+ antiporter subunit B
MISQKANHPNQSVLLAEGAKMMLPLLFLISIYLWYYGKDHPGGGFSGGLVAAAAFALDIIAFGTSQSKRALSVQPQTVTGTGIILMFVSGIIPILVGKQFLTAIWINAGEMAIGTPMIFEAGIYLVVAGVVLTIIYSLAE